VAHYKLSQDSRRHHRNRQSTSSSALLKHYHWLPIHQRIQFKIACIIYNTIHTTQPAYLNSVLEHYTLARTLRSFDTNLLSVPRVRTCFGFRSFSVAAPTIWNSFPFDIRNSCSISFFRRQLKTLYFQLLAMSSAPPHSSPQRLRFGKFLAGRHCVLYKLNLLTYLLTNTWLPLKTLS